MDIASTDPPAVQIPVAKPEHIQLHPDNLAEMAHADHPSNHRWAAGKTVLYSEDDRVWGIALHALLWHI